MVAGTETNNQTRRGKKGLRLVLMVGGVVVTIAVGLMVWLGGGRYVSTDDAYVQADKLMVSADISGTVLDVAVKEGQEVHKGDVLFRLDPTPFRIALMTAQSRLDESVLDLKAMEQDYQRVLSDIDAQRARVQLAESNLARQEALLKIGGTAAAAADQAGAELRTARATASSLQNQSQVQLARLGGQRSVAVEEHPEYLQAKAARDEAQRQLDHTVVRAPFDGTVTQVSSLQPGAMIVSSMAAFMPTSAVALVSNGHVWVQANLKETDLAYVHEGNPVTITVDAVPGREFHGVVDSLAPATGSAFSVLPSENGSGNWVKVVQRVPVRIAFAPGEDVSLFRLGMSTTISIDTGHKRSLNDLF